VPTLGLDVGDGRQVCGFLSVRVELLRLNGLAVVFIAAASIALSRLEIVGRREGRLIERRR
jgi:hypothetical protein